MGSNTLAPWYLTINVIFEFKWGRGLRGGVALAESPGPKAPQSTNNNNNQVEYQSTSVVIMILFNYLSGSNL